MGKRILIIDDDVNILEILEDVFIDNGFQVETATGTTARHKRRGDLCTSQEKPKYL
jgi:DNA-binding response OmpR family regulator